MANKVYKPLLIDSIKAEENIVQQRFIGFDGKYCKAGAKAIGVADVDVDKGQFVPVAITGVLLVEAGGTISIGDAITSDDLGRAVKPTSPSEINGYAQDDATEGQIIRILRGI